MKKPFMPSKRTGIVTEQASMEKCAHRNETTASPSMVVLLSHRQRSIVHLALIRVRLPGGFSSIAVPITATNTCVHLSSGDRVAERRSI